MAYSAWLDDISIMAFKAMTAFAEPVRFEAIKDTHLVGFSVIKHKW